MLVDVISSLRCFLAFENENCIGYSLVLVDHQTQNNDNDDDENQRQQTTAEIVNVFVSPSYRSLYIGKHLINSTLFNLKLNRFTRVTCLVEANNTSAVCFMENNGFELMDKLGLSHSGYSQLISSIRRRNRSTYIYFRVLNFYYLFLEFNLVKFN